MLLILGGIFGAIGIAMGAWGAHSLSKKLSNKEYNSFLNGIRYHQMHALLLVAAGLGQSVMPNEIGEVLEASGWLLLLGTLMFSGGIYGQVLTKNERMGVISPVGGIIMIMSWFGFAMAGYMTL